MDCNFRYMINVERLNVVKDSYGSITSNYVLYLTLKASIKYLSGNKVIDNQEIFNTNTLQISTYYRDINESDRILYNNKYYKILSIQEIGYKEGLLLTVEKINM